MNTADLAELDIQRQTVLAQRRKEIEGRVFRVHQAMLRFEDWQDEQEIADVRPLFRQGRA